jgi:hypothetical protein
VESLGRDNANNRNPAIRACVQSMHLGRCCERPKFTPESTQRRSHSTCRRRGCHPAGVELNLIHFIQTVGCIEPTALEQFDVGRSTVVRGATKTLYTTLASAGRPVSAGSWSSTPFAACRVGLAARIDGEAPARLSGGVDLDVIALPDKRSRRETRRATRPRARRPHATGCFEPDEAPASCT